MEQVERCGWFCYTPIYFQRFKSVSWVILFLSLGAIMQGTIVNGLLHYVIVTIEHRFNLRSSESGLVSGGYDIASLIFLIPITFFGGRPRSHKPKWIGIGLIIIGMGSFIFCLPYFLAPKRNIVNEHAIEILCNQTSRLLTLEKDNLKDSQLSGYKWILLLGNFFHGLGAVPLFTLAVTYIDENVPRRKSSLCLGLFYSAAALGPALGYILGGNLLQLHEDFWKKDSLGLMITPENKAWIGAWWFGFIICGIIIFIVAIPVLGLPPKLPDWKEIQRSRVSEAVIVVNRTKAYEHFHELPKAMFELLRNSSFVFINLAGCCEGIIISGSGTFIPKIIQVQFHLSSKTVAYVMGVVAVPSAVMGILMGGGIIKRYDLKFNGILKLCICSTILALLSSSGFFFTCSSEKFAGVNVPYFNETTLSINHPCNEQCKCEYNDFSPTCGINNVLYFSPCYAGCTTSSSVADKIMHYHNCSCINRDSSHDYHAINQSCFYPCSNLPHFLILVYFTLFFTFVCAIPIVNATLRCVKSDQTSLAMGTQWMIARLGGFVPGPILFGILIDDVCTHWLRSHDKNNEGSCYMYDNYWLGRYIVILAYGWKALELAFFSLSLWCYNINQRNNLIEEEEKEEEGEENELEN